MHAVDEVRHIRGFEVTTRRVLQGCKEREFDWPELERFREAFLPTVRDERLRNWAAEVFAQRIDRHPLRQFTPEQARAIASFAKNYARSATK